MPNVPTVCRECSKNLGGQPYIGFSPLAFGKRGSSKLCIDCYVILQAKPGVPSRLDNFMKWYVESNKPKSVSELQERIRELEYLIAAKG